MLPQTQRDVLAWQVLMLALLSVAIFTPAQSHADTLTVSEPNGFLTDDVTDMMVKTEVGEVNITRHWNGQEWKVNPHWESLSTRFTNLTGSNSIEDSTTINTSTSLGSASFSTSSKPTTSTATSIPECWVWVDDDWQPSTQETWTDLSGKSYQGMAPVNPKRTTPFNQRLSEDDNASATLTRVTVDYANLCAGYAGATGHTVQDKEAIRRQNELYLGDNGSYAFSNRSILKKQPINEPTPKPANALYQDFADGMASLDITTQEGYHWVDKGGDWIDYNHQGQVISWGDKNQNLTWLMRDLTGILRGVTDKQGRVLYSLHYDDHQRLSQIKDYPNNDLGDKRESRTVHYRYDNQNRLISITDVRGNTTTYEYDALNNLVKIDKQGSLLAQMRYEGRILTGMTDGTGNTTTYQSDYDHQSKEFLSKTTSPKTEAGQRIQENYHNRQGRLKRQVVNGQTQVDIKYDTINRVDHVTNVRGFTTQVERDEFGNIKTITYPDGSQQRHAHSPVHLGLTKSIDPLGVETRYERDHKGNLLKRIEAAGTTEARTTTYARNDKGQITAISYLGKNDDQDSTWQMSYDIAGNIKTVIDPEGHQSHYQYDRMGNLTAYTDGIGNTTTYQYDEAGNLVTKTDANGHSVQYHYDNNNILKRAIDENGNSTNYQHDPAGRLTGITHAEGGTYRISYNGQGQAIEETDEDGRRTEIRYDNFLRMQAHKDGHNNVTKYNYNLTDGNPGSLSAPTQIRYPTFEVQQRYDNMERPTTQTVLNPTNNGIQQTISKRTYDKRGMVVSDTDAKGNTRNYQYNALGQLIQITDALSNNTKFSYDNRGNLIQVTDAKQGTYHFSYDKVNRLTQETLPMGQSISYQYDNAGHIIAKQFSNGNSQQFIYDKSYRLTQVIHKDNQRVTVRTTQFDYDNVGNLTKWVDIDIVNNKTQQGELSYDKTNRQTQEKVTYDTGYELNYQYQYSLAGNKIAVTYPDGTIVNYDYSEHNQLKSVTIPNEGILNIDAFDWTAPKSLTLPGGQKVIIDHDGLLKPENTQITTSSGGTVFGLTQSYDERNLLQTRSRQDNLGTTTANQVESYQHDSEYRLIQVADKTNNLQQDYTYDALANRLKLSNKSQTQYHYNANNQLIQTVSNNQVTNYQYDSNGNLVSKSMGGEMLHYSYDTNNRLVKVESEQNGNRRIIAHYRYDPFNRRTIKEAYQANGSGLKTYYLYSQEGLVAEATQVITHNNGENVTEQGQPTLTTIYGNTPDNPNSTNVLFIRTKNSNDTDMVGYYVHDQLGTPLQAIDKFGNVVWAMQYDAFGNTTDITPKATTDKPTIISNLRLPGQYMDSETGLYYNWNRYYDPMIGRYTTKDPLTYIDGWNYYVYLKANPLMNADPEGKYGLMGAIGSAGFSAGTQFALNMAAGADWKRALRCIDMADVLVSAALGAVGPGLGNIVKKPPADAVLTQGQNAYIYIMKVQPTGYVFKKGLEWRPFANGVDQCGNPRDDNCEELKITNAISPFLQ